jgi:hypothetical protein
MVAGVMKPEQARLSGRIGGLVLDPRDLADGRQEFTRPGSRFDGNGLGRLSRVAIRVDFSTRGQKRQDLASISRREVLASLRPESNRQPHHYE